MLLDNRRAELTRLAQEADDLESEVHVLDLRLKKAAPDKSMDDRDFGELCDQTASARRRLWALWRRIRELREAGRPHRT